MDVDMLSLLIFRFVVDVCRGRRGRNGEYRHCWRCSRLRVKGSWMDEERDEWIRQLGEGCCKGPSRGFLELRRTVSLALGLFVAVDETGVADAVSGGDKMGR